MSVDTHGDFRITGHILNQWPIYSGTLLAIQGNFGYLGTGSSQGKLTLTAPVGVEVVT